MLLELDSDRRKKLSGQSLDPIFFHIYTILIDIELI